MVHHHYPLLDLIPLFLFPHPLTQLLHCLLLVIPENPPAILVKCLTLGVSVKISRAMLEPSSSVCSRGTPGRCTLSEYFWLESFLDGTFFSGVFFPLDVSFAPFQDFFLLFVTSFLSFSFLSQDLLMSFFGVTSSSSAPFPPPLHLPPQVASYFSY